MLLILKLLVGGFFCGLFSSLFGIGGGVFLVPLLLSFSLSIVQAAGTSNIVVFIASILSLYRDKNNINKLPWREIIIAGVFSVVFSGGGVWLSHNLPQKIITILFVVFLFISAILTKNNIHASTQAMLTSKYRMWKFLFIGIIVGILSGMLGVGGGIFLVPFFTRFLYFPLRMAACASLGVIVITSFASSIGHAYYGSINWQYALLLSAGVAIGVYFGKVLKYKISDKYLVLLFRVFIFVIMAWTIANII